MLRERLLSKAGRVTRKRKQQRLEAITGPGAYVRRAQLIAGDIIGKGAASNVSDGAAMLGRRLLEKAPWEERTLATASPLTLSKAWHYLVRKREKVHAATQERIRKAREGAEQRIAKVD